MLLPLTKPSLSQKLKKYLAKDKKFAKIFKAVEKDFKRAKHLTAHNWEHAYRDTLNAIVVGEAEKADMKIVLPAIVMHDIGFLYGAKPKEHGEVGAKKLPVYLKKIGVTYPASDIKRIAECIRTHKGSVFNVSPITLEAKVVADADILEKFGLFGVYQTIRTFTEFNESIDYIVTLGERMSNRRLETKTGEKLAEKGRAFVVNFFKQLDQAYKPYR